MFHANAKGQQLDEWEQIIKVFPINALKEKQAGQLMLSLPKKRGSIGCASAVGQLIL